MVHEIINGVIREQAILESLASSESDVLILQSDIRSALSDLVILKSDLETIASDTVCINITKVASDMAALVEDVSDIYSDLNAIDAILSDIYSDIFAHDNLLVIMASDVDSVASDITIVNTMMSDIQVEMDTVSDLLASITGTSKQIEVEYSDISGAKSIIVRIANPTRLGTPENIIAGNYSEFEADGTLVAKGSATTYKDIYTHITPRTTGVGKPALQQFSGDIYKYTFAINDVSELKSIEFPHDGVEGSLLDIHIHWASNGLDVTNRGVKWEISYTWANTVGKIGQTAFPVPTIISAETQIPHDTPNKTLLYTIIGTFTPLNWVIDGQILMSIKRIASVVDAAPTSNPWCLAVGVHYQVNTFGSRTSTDK